MHKQYCAEVTTKIIKIVHKVISGESFEHFVHCRVLDITWSPVSSVYTRRTSSSPQLPSYK